MKAIETKYKGYRFRSRLEARWAVFFDALGVDWEYEPEGFHLDSGDKYLPDFWIPAPRFYSGGGYFLEIKRKGTPSPAESRKCRNLADNSGHTTIMLCGDPVEYDVYEYSHSGKESHFSKHVYDGDFHVAVRFYDGQTGDIPHSLELVRESGQARSARFEHGESPC